jgi:hypothetical protein
VVIDRSYEPAPDLPSVERGRRVDFKMEVSDFKTRSELRHFRWQVLPGKPSVETFMASDKWRPPVQEPQFIWNPPETGDHTIAVQYIDRDLNYSTPTLISFTVVPPWYLNAWIVGPFGGITGSLVIWAFVARSMVARRKRESG